MYISKKKINTNNYYYLEEKINNKTVNTFMSSSKIKYDVDFLKIFKEQRLKAVLKKTNDVKKKYKLKHLTTAQIYELEKLKYNLNIFKKYFKESYEQFYEDEYIRYYQGSASVEGNTINLKEAGLIIKENISVEGKNIDEIKEIQNLKASKKIIDKFPEITETTIKKIHAAIMNGFENKTPGKYREIPIYVIGSDVKRPNYKEIPNKMKLFVDWYNKNKSKMHPIELTSIMHVWFECLHPFIDGNGRVGRELLNLILLKNNYPYVIINLKNKNKYFSVLENLYSFGFKEYNKFSEFVYDLLIKRSNIIEKEIEENIDVLYEKLKK